LYIVLKEAIKGNTPNAYYGLALLYKMAGQQDAGKSVLETMFTRIPHRTLAKEHAAIYAEAQNLYNELSKGMKQ